MEYRVKQVTWCIRCVHLQCCKLKREAVIYFSDRFGLTNCGIANEVRDGAIQQVVLNYRLFLLAIKLTCALSHRFGDLFRVDRADLGNCQQPLSKNGRE